MRPQPPALVTMLKAKHPRDRTPSLICRLEAIRTAMVGKLDTILPDGQRLASLSDGERAQLTSDLAAAIHWLKINYR